MAPNETVLISIFYQAIEKKLGAQTEAEKQKSETNLVNFRDNLSLRLQSLKGLHGFDPIAAEKAMLSLTPSAALLNYPKPSVKEQREIAARFQVRYLWLK